jgi:putative acyl-CoA dehydrogenase
VICLDALRAMTRSGDALAALMDEIAAAPDPRIQGVAGAATRMLSDRAAAEANARSIVEALALCMQASLMKRHSSASAAESFCESRLGAAWNGSAFGTLVAGTDTRAIVERAELRT